MRGSERGGFSKKAGQQAARKTIEVFPILNLLMMDSILDKEMSDCENRLEQYFKSIVREFWNVILCESDDQKRPGGSMDIPRGLESDRRSQVREHKNNKK